MAFNKKVIRAHRCEDPAIQVSRGSALRAGESDRDYLNSVPVAFIFLLSDPHRYTRGSLEESSRLRHLATAVQLHVANLHKLPLVLRKQLRQNA